MKLSANSIILIKIGTSSISDAGGSIDPDRIKKLAHQLFLLKRQGLRPVLVSSGAIRAGMEKLGIKKRPKSLAKLQACAAAGQSALMEIYNFIFQIYKISVAQILVTRDDFRYRDRFFNVRNTVHSLLALDCLPIINENDTVATDEIKFGENDTLSAIAAAAIGADLLINLSDVSGLYTANPKLDGSADLIPRVDEITGDIISLGGSSVSGVGSGGMRSKIKAALIATDSGVNMIIAGADEEDVVTRICGGEPCGTLFCAKSKPLNPKKCWMAFAAKTDGSITVNANAEQKIKSGTSLLPVGITGIEGSFDSGDLVNIKNERGKVFAKGTAYYSAEELARIMGRHTYEIKALLGSKDYDEAVHHNNMVLIGTSREE
ncbi:MAG: glutamate 5-kinase [Abditibacteriota bacterium]|nr:glutamate 5-kinase [Abditibacteriota bacterium]